MNAAVFIAPGRIKVVSRPMPDVGPHDVSIGPRAEDLGNHKLKTALRPGGIARMRRLLNIVASGRLDLGLLHPQPSNLQLAIAHD